MPSQTSPPTTISRRLALVSMTAALAGLAVRHSFAEESFIFGNGMDGHPVRSLRLGTTVCRCIVPVFVATDCPISNRYLPMLAELSTHYAARQALFWLVYPNRTDTLAAVREHGKQYPAAATIRQLVDPNPTFVGWSHVHVTPEAAIFAQDWAVGTPALWHGRIDDRYLTFGQQRPAATHHDLANAIDAVLAGDRPIPPAAPPVGCAIIPWTTSRT